jgi:hypothetical protein
MTELRVDWDRPGQIGQEGWQALLSKCPRANAFQSWSWGATTAVTHAHQNKRAVILAGNRPIGLMQLSERRYLGAFTFAQLIRGPLFVSGGATAAAMPHVLKHLRHLYRPSRGKVLALTPELEDGPVADKFLRDARFINVKTGMASAWIDISPNQRLLRRGLRPNFRNQLKKAEASALSVKPGDDSARDWLIDHHAIHRKQGRYSGPTPELLRALPLEEMTVLTAHLPDREEAVAGVLFLRHGLTATYEVGWTAEEGRELHAHNLLLWQGIAALKAAGIRRLDVGGLDDAEAGGAAHFKRGLGGDSFTLAGTFV